MNTIAKHVRYICFLLLVTCIADVDGWDCNLFVLLRRLLDVYCRELLWRLGIGIIPIKFEFDCLLKLDDVLTWWCFVNFDWYSLFEAYVWSIVIAYADRRQIHTILLFSQRPIRNNLLCLNLITCVHTSSSEVNRWTNNIDEPINLK